MKLHVLAITALIATSAFAERWDGANHPNNFSRVAGANLTTQFDLLPITGNLADTRYGWSESYWPSNLGGIAYRWNHPDPQPFRYALKTKEQLMSMSEAELGQLSPAELYDIAQGDYNYSLTRSTLRRFTPRDLWWEGICHGWAQAAANYPEPAPVTVTNRDGIHVPFGASDVKALLAHHEAYNFGGKNPDGSNIPYGFVGKRCRVRGKVPGEEDSRDGRLPTPTVQEMESPDCRDVNAGAFHVVVANMIGIHSKSFVADIDRLNDVWNQPITGYNSSIVAEVAVSPAERATGIERKLQVQTKFIYGEELKFWTPELAATGIHNFVSKLPVTNTIHQEFRSKNYEYVLELDASGRIIGGDWISATRPDFMWMYGRAQRFNNKKVALEGLNRIYRPVRR